ncbi:hypothetical protein G9A89_019382 [Geosiphon pyriformis]|nr:hypothetical protein G9A89_019382 [Geosiphon pyriformis]
MQSSIYQSPVYQAPIYQPQPQVIYQQLQPQIIYQLQQIQTPPQSLPPNRTQRPKITQQSWRSAMVVHQPILSSLQQSSGLHQQNLGTSQTQNPNSQNYLSLLVTPEDASTNNLAFTQKQPLTSNIPLATITEDKFLAAIFPFKLEETATMPLFSGATLEAKPITVMYTDAKVERQSIKLILNSSSADTDGAIKTPIGKIDDFSFEVHGIVTPIKVLVIEVTQYQALVGNNWLSKVNMTLNWNIQELQLTYQGQYIRVPATCGHFKTPPRKKLLIKLEEKKKKPTWEAYQVLWADKGHNELPPILPWDDNDNEKGKQKEELTWETNDLIWTDNDESELTSSWE